MLSGKPHTVHKEKWYTFYRVHFSDGYIDLYKGNILDNPNEDERSIVRIANGSSYYVRIEGGTVWYHNTNPQFLRKTELTESAEKVFKQITEEMPETTDDLRAIKKELKDIHSNFKKK